MLHEKKEWWASESKDQQDHALVKPIMKTMEPRESNL
jgi:hypothetical protein